MAPPVGNSRKLPLSVWKYDLLISPIKEKLLQSSFWKLMMENIILWYNSLCFLLSQGVGKNILHNPMRSCAAWGSITTTALYLIRVYWPQQIKSCLFWLRLGVWEMTVWAVWSGLVLGVRSLPSVFTFFYNTSPSSIQASVFFFFLPEPQFLLSVLLGLADVLFPHLNSAHRFNPHRWKVSVLHSTVLQHNLSILLKSSAWNNLHSFVWSPLWHEQHKTY